MWILSWSPAQQRGLSANGANWNEWWENGWFDVLEKLPKLPVNDNSYIGAVRVVNGAPEHWIGLFFPADTEVPVGFDHVDMEPMEYAMLYLYGDKKTGELFGIEPHNLCLAELKARSLKRKEDDWCLERCNCPRFTDPDEHGFVILDYAISIER